jgi:translocation and assembly module TamB
VPYKFTVSSAIQASLQMQNASLEDIETISGQTSVPVTGTLSGNASVSGTLDNLHGSGHISVAGGTIYGERYKSVTADIVGDHSDIGIANLVFMQNGGRITGNGGYDLHADTLHADLTGSGFELAHIQKLQTGSRPIGGALAFHFTAAGPVASPSVNGNASLHGVTLGDQALGQMTATVHTEAHVAYLDLTSNLLDSNLQLHGNVALSGDYNSQAALTITNVDLQPLVALYEPQARGLHTALTGSQLSN